MHHHRNAGAALAPRRASTPPPAGPVQGLGLVDAFRIDLDPAQLPWLAAEIDIVQYCLEDELAHQRKATSSSLQRQRSTAGRKRAKPSRSSTDAPTSSRCWR